ncbi:MAG TPA: glycosyltransferase family 4 protein, partial [Candidatus Binatia bacterium]|nr:glycosyltransferase family 4 protein [Candidatus Binatia bacterium]
ELAARGHRVTVALLSYAGLGSEESVQAGVRWTSDDAFAGATYLRRIRECMDDSRPDWVVGASDTWFGILAARSARHAGTRCAVDAYDNFESYLPWALPLHWAWRRAVREASLVTAAGPQLAERLGAGHRRVEVLPMTADPAFQAMDRERCRHELGLPQDERLVGVVGSLDERRGARHLLAAMERVRERGIRATLVVTGRSAARWARHAGVRALGALDDRQVPVALNALDVACVPAADNAFGRFSYPAKLCEALACGVPVVASDTAPIRWMLGGDHPGLAPPGDPLAIADAIAAALASPRAQRIALPAWSAVAERYERLLLAASSSSNSAA